MRDLVTFARTSLAGLRVLLLMTLVVGLAYPLVVTGIATVAFPWQARGSLVDATGRHVTETDTAVGSVLLAQSVDASAGLFVPRPSAGDHDPLATGGSNLGPNDASLVGLVEERRAEVARREGVPEAAVPPDAVTASASGLDPHISPAYADLQVARVARAQGLSEDRVRALVAEHTTGRALGVLGEPRVDVLALDLAVLRASGGQ